MRTVEPTISLWCAVVEEYVRQILRRKFEFPFLFEFRFFIRRVYGVYGENVHVVFPGVLVQREVGESAVHLLRRDGQNKLVFIRRTWRSVSQVKAIAFESGQWVRAYWGL